jgi:amidohydrolase
MNISNETIKDLARKIYPAQVKWRRHFHQHPELSDREFKTTELIKNELKKHHIRLLPLRIPTGAVAVIGGKGKTTAAIRTDIDALPITEQNKIPYRSKNTGIMHACGHDMHMAIVLGTAIILNDIKENLNGHLKIIFQPAEEKPPGGAAMMLKAGIFRKPRVEMIFGLHVDPSLPTGKIGLRDGPTMASVLDFDIIVKGKGGHAARPHNCTDAIVVASELVCSIQKIASREVNPLEPVVITFGKISGGTTRNVIADEVILHGTARTLSPNNIGKLPLLIKRTARGIGSAFGAECIVNFIAEYPLLSNYPSANKILASSFRDLFGDKGISKVNASMGGEDFAYYLQEAPGAMFRLGIRNKKIGAIYPWHHPKFQADEEAIFFGTSILIKAALEFFNNKQE